jgi:small subunit ribosomal protein S4
MNIFMGNRSSSKHKISRRLGTDIWGTAKSSFNKRPYKPGEKHSGMDRPPSNYGLQLMEKQKLRAHYGTIVEKQFKKFFREAKRLKGDTGGNFVNLLERRLDSMVYRFKIAPTIFTARQFVSHGHILVNGRRVDIPSYITKVGDTIEIVEKMRNAAIVQSSIASVERQIPSYIKFDEKHVKGSLVGEPTLELIPFPMKLDLNLVVEWYSRMM